MSSYVGKAQDPLTDLDIDELVERLTPGEIQKLLEECDPDDEHMPPSMRCSYNCDKMPTGPLDRKHLLDYINEQAKKTPDKPDLVPHVPGTVRGKKWVAPQVVRPASQEEEIELDIDFGDDIELALNSASTSDMIDLAGIMGLHSMMNQDQYHAAMSDKCEKADPDIGWDGITKATPLKVYPPEEPNRTDPVEVLEKVRANDKETEAVNLNNVCVSEQQFLEIFEVLKSNDVLTELSMANTTMTDYAASKLCSTLEENQALDKLNVESNNVSPRTLAKMFESINVHQAVTEVRASNQHAQFLGNKVEIAITKAIENNKSLLKVGLQFEFNDCRNRVAVQLQKNLDRIRLKRIAHKLAQRGNVTAGYFAPLPGSITAWQQKESTPESEYEYYYSDDEDDHQQQ